MGVYGEGRGEGSRRGGGIDLTWERVFVAPLPLPLIEHAQFHHYELFCTGHVFL